MKGLDGFTGLHGKQKGVLAWSSLWNPEKKSHPLAELFPTHCCTVTASQLYT